MSTQFDRHPFDDALTHNAQLKVGGLETPRPDCVEKDAEVKWLWEEIDTLNKEVMQIKAALKKERIDALRYAARLCDDVAKEWGGAHARSALECSLIVQAAAATLEKS